MLRHWDVVPGRDCQGCTLCCFVLCVEELEKPPMASCADCVNHVGCKIHETRPYECREFYCRYLCDAGLGEHWKPAQSGIVVAPDEHSGVVVIHEDPERPDAWRREPFYTQIRKWALEWSKTHQPVYVWQNNTRITVIPEGLHDPDQPGSAPVAAVSGP